MPAFWRPIALCLAAGLSLPALHPAAAFDTSARGRGAPAAETDAPPAAAHVLTPRRPEAGSTVPTVSNDCAAYSQPAAGQKARRTAPGTLPGCTQTAAKGEAKPESVAEAPVVAPAAEVAADKAVTVK